jgi:hypothetical protein
LRSTRRETTKAPRNLRAARCTRDDDDATEHANSIRWLLQA